MINYKHLIGSLSKKPGAFGLSKIKEDILPSQVYIDIWHYLETKCEKRQACKIIVGILQIAAETNKETEIGFYVKEIMEANKLPYLELLRKKFKANTHTETACEIQVERHDLKSYNLLLNQGSN